jgi:hypothetical protein
MKMPTIRKIPGLDAIEEAVGRCTETGKMVHYSVGDYGGLNTEFAPEIIAGVSVLRYVASLVAKYKSKILVSTPYPEALTLIEDTLKSGYADAGAPDYFKGDQVRYIPMNAYQPGVLGILTEENVGANIMIGPFSGATVLWGMTTSAVGAIGIAGTGRTAQIPYMVVCFDYSILGEEVFAAGAYVTKEPYIVSALVANDLLRVFIISILLLGTLFLTMGNNEILKLFTW